MNLRMYSMALLVSAIPLFAHAEAFGISLNRGDFKSAERIERDGSTVVSVKLSKSGRAKFKKLNKLREGEFVHTEVAGVASDFKIREPIKGDSLEMGPYSTDVAQKIITEINQ